MDRSKFRDYLRNKDKYDVWGERKETKPVRPPGKTSLAVQPPVRTSIVASPPSSPGKTGLAAPPPNNLGAIIGDQRNKRPLSPVDSGNNKKSRMDIEDGMDVDGYQVNERRGVKRKWGQV